MMDKFPNVTNTRCLLVPKSQQRRVPGQFPVTAAGVVNYVFNRI
jgi:hypothetical protein